MQTSPLPNLAAGVSANATPQRTGSSSEAGDGQFSAALSREIVQRADATPAQQPAAHPRASKAGTHPLPVQAPAQAPAQAPTQGVAAADSNPTQAGKAATPDEAAESKQEEAGNADSAAASQQAADPMADMLALVANYHQLLKQGTAAPTAAPTANAKAGDSASDGSSASAGTTTIASVGGSSGTTVTSSASGDDAGSDAATDLIANAIPRVSTSVSPSAAPAMPGATLPPAGLPSDQAIAAIAGRFASQMQPRGAAASGPALTAAHMAGKAAAAGSSRAAQEPLSSVAPSSAPSAAPTSAPEAQASLSPSTAPSLAPGIAPTMGPTFAPTGAPSAAPAEFSAHLANALPDAAAAQMLAATTAPTIAPMAAQLVRAGDKINARVGTSAWDEQVGQKIVWMVGGGEQSASLTLNPPDLGPMQVVLSVNGDQASVAFSSAHQEVRHALESALPRLREMMDQSGLSLGSATVSAGTQGQGQGQAQGQWQGGGSNGARFGNQGTDTVAGTETVEGPRPRRTTIVGDNGMVDTFA